MINLTAASPKHADSSVVEATAASGGSPMAGAGGEALGASGVGGGKRLFGAMLASAFGASPRSSIAGARGNGLPVPPLQEREVGAGIRLITAEGAERLGEDALFAFAVSQGLDASLVASVLWPGIVDPTAPDKSGVTGSPGAMTDSDRLIGLGDPDQLGQVSPAEYVAALSAGLPTERAGRSAAVSGYPAAGSPAGVGGLTDPATTEASDAPSPGAGIGQLSGEFSTPLSAGMSGLSGFHVPSSAGLATAAGPGGVAMSEGVQAGSAGVSALAGATVTTEGARIGGQPGTAAGLGDVQSLAGAVSLPGPIAVTAGVEPSQSAALDRQAVTLPTVDALRVAGGAGGGPAADLDIQSALTVAAIRLSEAKGQVRLATEGVSGMLSAAGATAVASYANLPAQWVLTGASPNARAGVGHETGLDEPVDASVLSEVDGAGAHALDAGHKQNAQRATSTAADPIDLSAEGGRATSAADPDSENSLARRLAEGLAQRMLAAASGNTWKVQIDLKPAHLGPISVEMSMQQGQLEAVFDAGQASARQLISEGLDRLRQDLQRAGMNVAHLGLSFGSGAGTGGKPTPRGREGQSDQGAAGSVQGVSTAVPGSRSRADSDGLDVMV